MHYLLFYEKAADYAARQGPLQPAHRAHLSAAVRRGELLLAGSLADPVDGSGERHQLAAEDPRDQDGRSHAADRGQSQPKLEHALPVPRLSAYSRESQLPARRLAIPLREAGYRIASA